MLYECLMPNDFTVHLINRTTISQDSLAQRKAIFSNCVPHVDGSAISKLLQTCSTIDRELSKLWYARLHFVFETLHAASVMTKRVRNANLAMIQTIQTPLWLDDDRREKEAKAIFADGATKMSGLTLWTFRPGYSPIKTHRQAKTVRKLLSILDSSTVLCRVFVKPTPLNHVCRTIRVVRRGEELDAEETEFDAQAYYQQWLEKERRIRKANAAFNRTMKRLRDELV
jgi:hypothetical protein